MQRSGSTTTVFVLDVSRSMGKLVRDPGDGTSAEPDDSLPPVQKLVWAKEYLNRKLVQLLSTERKTEHVCIVTVGGATNNPHAQDGYPDVEVLVEPQTVKEWMIDRVLAVEVGKKRGDPLSGIVIALGVLGKTTEITKPSWIFDLTVLTDGLNEMDHEEFVPNIVKLLGRMDKAKAPAHLTIAGFNFADKSWSGITEENKSEIQIENENIYRSIKKQRKGSMVVGNIYRAVLVARTPVLKEVKPTATKYTLRIGSYLQESKEAIEIAVTVGKMTAEVKPLSTKKFGSMAGGGSGNGGGRESQSQASTSANGAGGGEGHVSTGASAFPMGLPSFLTAAPPRTSTMNDGGISQSQTYLESQAYSQPSQSQFPPGFAASQVPPPTAGFSSSSSRPVILPTIITGHLKPATKYMVDMPAKDGGGERTSMPVDKADLQKAHRFGSTHVIGNVETRFATEKGIDLYKFMPLKCYDREFMTSEVSYMWPDPKSAKSQIEFSSLVQAMLSYPDDPRHKHKGGEMLAVLRYVYNNNLPPSLCIAKAMYNDKEQAYLVFAKLPYADDYRRFFFPALENVRNTGKKLLEKHTSIPTLEQRSIIDSLVDSLNLSAYDAAHSDEEDIVFDPHDSFNPAVHRIKEAVYYQYTASEGDPLRPPQPELTRFFSQPAQIARKANKLGKRARVILDVAKVPPRKKKKDKDVAPLEEAGLDDILQGRASRTKTGFTPPPDDPRDGSPMSDDGDLVSALPAAAGGSTSTTAPPEDGSGSETEDEGTEGFLRAQQTKKEPKEQPLVPAPADLNLEQEKRSFERKMDIEDEMDDAMSRMETLLMSLVNAGRHRDALDLILLSKASLLEREHSVRFNSILKRLKKYTSSRRSFWTFFTKEGGREASLITFKNDPWHLSEEKERDAIAFLS